MTDDGLSAELESHYAAVVRIAAGGGPRARTPTTLLHIGDDHAVVLSGRSDRPESVHRLDLGAVRVARECFHHSIPSSHEIERAIDLVEDELMRLDKPSDVAGTLWSTSTALRAWSTVAGPNLPIENVEQWFQQFASVSLGQPGAMQGLPSGREAAATLPPRVRILVASIEPGRS